MATAPATLVPAAWAVAAAGSGATTEVEGAMTVAVTYVNVDVGLVTRVVPVKVVAVAVAA